MVYPSLLLQTTRLFFLDSIPKIDDKGEMSRQQFFDSE